MKFHCTNAPVVLRICAPKCSGGSADLRTLEGTLVTRDSAWFDNNDSEPKSKLRYMSSQKKIEIFKDTYHRKHSFIFPMSEWVGLFVAKRLLQTTKWRNPKINWRPLEKFQATSTIFKSWNHALHSLEIHSMLMYRWWLSSSLTVCFKLVYCWNKTDQNARKSGSKKL